MSEASAGAGVSPRFTFCQRSFHSAAIFQASAPSAPHRTIEKPSAFILSVGNQ
jgi:hypothetical protein